MLRVVRKLRQNLHRSSGGDIKTAAALLNRTNNLDINSQKEEPLHFLGESNSEPSVCKLIIPSQLFVECNMDSLKCNIFLSQYDKFSDQFKNFGIRIFSTDDLQYESFCDDFGPMNMMSVTKFIAALDLGITNSNSPNLVYLVKPGKRSLTNAAFLLGAYMILKLGQSPESVAAAFSALESKFEGFRDATFSSSATTFRLQLIDCWKGLHHAKALRWLAMPTSETPQLWGQIDMTAYERYDDPLNGDLHVVVPGLFVAFCSPKDVPGRQYKDNYRGDTFASRDFSPSYYTEIFQALEVTTVVRLNEACYSRSDFTSVGLAHYDLFFEDCTAPPAEVVARFFDITDGAPPGGLVAVHCKAGLGRTGTLIALSLMRHHGFSARTAMGWLRVMRPGSVIGEQQQFLCAVEACLRQRDASHTPSSPPLAPRSPGGGGIAARRVRNESRYSLPMLPTPPLRTCPSLAAGSAGGRAIPALDAAADHLCDEDVPAATEALQHGAERQRSRAWSLSGVGASPHAEACERHGQADWTRAEASGPYGQAAELAAQVSLGALRRGSARVGLALAGGLQ